MKKPLVSVVVAAYNEEKNIKRFLQSVNNQTYKHIESIVVDDESTDTTVKIANKFATKVYARKHAERSIQRNFGVEKAKGKYVLMLDADMELTPRVVESCVEVLSSTSHKALVVPEKTVGEGAMARIRAFEREMYVGDPTI